MTTFSIADSYGSYGNSPQSDTRTVALTEGDLLIMVIGNRSGDAASTLTASDSNGKTWSYATLYDNELLDANARCSARMAYRLVEADEDGAGFDITATCSGGNSVSMDYASISPSAGYSFSLLGASANSGGTGSLDGASTSTASLSGSDLLHVFAQVARVAGALTGVDVDEYTVTTEYDEHERLSGTNQITGQIGVVQDGQAGGTFTVTSNLFGANIGDAEGIILQAVFENASGAGAQTITGADHVDTDSFGSGAIVAGPVTITGVKFDNLVSFGAGSVSTSGGPLTLTGTAFVDSDAFGAGTITKIPPQFGESDWTLVDLGTGGTLRATPVTFPADVVATDYSIDGGGAILTGDVIAYDLSGLNNDQSYNVRIRGRNASGQAGPWSAPKSATPTVGTQVITGQAHSDADSFGAGTVTPGAVQITGTVHINPNSFGAGLVSAEAVIGGAAHVNPSSFGAGLIQVGEVTITGTLHIDPDNFGAGLVSVDGGPQPIAGQAHDDPDSFGAGTVTPGEVTIDGQAHDDPDSFGAGVVSVAGGPQAISGQALDDTDSFGSGGVSVTITGTLYVNAQQFYFGQIQPGGVIIVGNALIDTDSFGAGAASLATGPQTIEGQALDDTDTLGSGRVTGGVVIEPERVEALGSAVQGSFVVASVNASTLVEYRDGGSEFAGISGGALFDADSFGSGTVAGGDAIVAGSDLYDEDTFGAGTVTVETGPASPFLLSQAVNDFAKAPSTTDVAWVASSYQQKMDQTIDVDSSGEIIAYDFSKPNAMWNSNVAGGYSGGTVTRFHPFVWHKAFPLQPARMSIRPDNWRTILTDYANAIRDNFVGVGATHCWEINEVVSNGNDNGSATAASDYWTAGDWFDAADTDAGWTDPSEFWWWHAIQAMDTSFLTASQEVGLVDYSLEFASSHQPGSDPDNVYMDTMSYAVHRFERMRRNVIQTNLERDNGGLPRGIDFVGYQAHLKSDKAFSEDLLKWQARTWAALNVKVDFTELNMEKGQAADALWPGSPASGFVRLGLTGAQKEAYAKDYIKRVLRPFYAAGVGRNVVFWTDVTDQGSDQADGGHDDLGNPTYVSEAVRELLQETITPDPIRGGKVWLAGRSIGHREFDIAGTVTGINAWGIAGTNLTLPLSHWYQDVAGTLTPMDGAEFEISAFVESASGAADQWLVSLQTAGNVNVFGVVHDGASFVLRTPSGDTPLPLAVSTGEYHKFTFQYSGTSFRFVQSRYDGGVITNAAAVDVISQTHTIGTPITKVALNNAARTLYLTGVFTLAVTDAELAARNEIAADEGGVVEPADFGWTPVAPVTHEVQPNGLTIVASFGADLDQGFDTALGEWAVTVDGVSNPVTTAGLGANVQTVELTVSQRIFVGETVLLSYSGSNLRFDGGSVIAAFTDASVTNDSNYPAAFEDADWTFTPTATPGEGLVTILQIPDGCDVIQYSVNGGAAQSSGGNVTFTISGLATDAVTNLRIRPNNAVDQQAGAYNGPKSITADGSG